MYEREARQGHEEARKLLRGTKWEGNAGRMRRGRESIPGGGETPHEVRRECGFCHGGQVDLDVLIDGRREMEKAVAAD